MKWHAFATSHSGGMTSLLGESLSAFRPDGVCWSDTGADTFHTDVQGFLRQSGWKSQTKHSLLLAGRRS